MDYATIAADGTELKRYVANTIATYATLARDLHAAAAMTVFHSLQYRECSALNDFFAGLRINDQTALKRWISKVTLCPGLDRNKMLTGDEFHRNPFDEPKTFISWTKDRGFFVRKGMKSEDSWTLAGLLATDPFYNGNVAEKKSIGLKELLAMLAKVESRAEKQGENNDVDIPQNIREALASLTKEVGKVAATVEVANDDNRSNVQAVAAN